MCMISERESPGDADSIPANPSARGEAAVCGLNAYLYIIIHNVSIYSQIFRNIKLVLN